MAADVGGESHGGSAFDAEKTLEALIRLYNMSEKAVAQILDQALVEVLAITRSAVGYIYFYDEHKHFFTLYSWSQGVMDICSVMEKKTNYELDKTGVWGEAVRQRAPVIVNDFQSYHPLKRGYPDGHVELTNFMTIPVFHGDEVVAVIGVGNKAGDYERHDVVTLELVAKGVWSLVLRKQAEEEVEAIRDRAQIQRIMDAAPIPVFYNDTAGMLVGCNTAFERYFNVKKEDVVGTNICGILVNSACSGVQDMALLCEVDSTVFETSIVVDGKERSVIVNKSAYAGEDGAFVGSIGAITDVTDNKNIERRMRWEHDLNKKILEYASVGMAVYKSDTGECVLANRALADVLGCTVEDVMAQNFREVDSWRISGRLAMAEKALNEGVTVNNDIHYINSFGKEMELDCTFVNVNSGNDKYLLRVDRDISERKKMEMEIRDQLVFVKTLANTMPSPTYYKNVFGEYVWCNRAYEAFRGMEMGKLVWLTAFDICSVEMAEYHQSKEQEMYESGQAIMYEAETFNAAGEKRTIMYNKAPFVDSEGMVRGLVSVMTDITERKGVEAELQERENTVRKILDGIHAGIVVVDPTTFSVVEVNEVAGKLLGKDQGALVGAPCTSIRWVRERDGSREESCPLLEGNIVNEVYKIERDDGSFVEVLKTVVSVVRSKRVLLYEILLDMTDRKLLERRLALAQRLESIGGLAAGIAHEINTPIQYVGDNLSFLEGAFAEMSGQLGKGGGHVDGGGDDDGLAYLLEEVPKAIAQSREGVERVAEIVRAMKRFSHAGGEAKSLLDVSKAIENTIMISRNEWKYHADIALDLDPAAQFLTCLPGDFNQVILNLVVNASHAISETYKDGQERGKITIRTRLSGDMLELSVADNGCGIPQKNINRIFDPFFTTKEVGKGTGQGLALCHDIVVNKHGGSISVESEPGKGTIFTLHFPMLNKAGAES